MKRPSFKTSKAFATASQMPPGLAIDWNNINSSPAYQWLINQPEIASYLIAKCRGSGAIILDIEAQKFTGKNNSENPVL